MEPCVNNKKLSEYLAIVATYFSDERIVEDGFMTAETYISLLRPQLINAWDRKRVAFEKWNEMLADINNLDWIYSARDMHFDTNEGFKVILHLKMPEDLNRLVGITIGLSFIGNLIGFQYSDTRTELNRAPVSSPLKYTVLSNPAQRQNNPEVSYQPINDQHVVYKLQLTNVVKQFFPDFVEFDNRYADYKVKGMQTELGYYTEIDLFQVFFGTNILGVI